MPSDVLQRTQIGGETLVIDKDIKFENVKAQSQTRNKDKSNNETGISRAERNEEISRFKRSQKEGQKKTKLTEQKEPARIVNKKRGRTRASRCMYCKTIFKTKEEQTFHRGSIHGCAFLCHKCPKEFRLKFSLR